MNYGVRLGKLLSKSPFAVHHAVAKSLGFKQMSTAVIALGTQASWPYCLLAELGLLKHCNFGQARRRRKELQSRDNGSQEKESPKWLGFESKTQGGKEGSGTPNTLEDLPQALAPNSSSGLGARFLREIVPGVCCDGTFVLVAGYLSVS